MSTMSGYRGISIPKQKYPSEAFALSNVSKVLLGYFALFFVGATAWTVNPKSHFDALDYCLVLLTIAQAIFAVALVNWKFHNLPLDSVVKCFVTGVFAAPVAFVIDVVAQLLVWTVFLIVFFIIVSIAWLVDGSSSSSDPGYNNNGSFGHRFLEDTNPVGAFTIFIMVLVAFFAITAIVQEMCIYGGYTLAAKPASHDARSPSPVEQGASIRAAMVTLSLGYLFCRTLGGIVIQERIATLLSKILGSAVAGDTIRVLIQRLGGSSWFVFLRAAMPVFPVAAAMQSLGICRRDVEKQERYGFRKILWPAILLHIAYDLAPAIVGFIVGMFGGDAVVGEEGIPATPSGVYVAQLAATLLVIVRGFYWYRNEAAAQRLRLQTMEEQDDGRVGLELVSEKADIVPQTNIA